MKAVIFLAALVCAHAALDLAAPALNGNIIRQINSNPQSTWRADVNNKFLGATLADAKRLCGVLPGYTKYLLKEQKPALAAEAIAALPTSFDWRNQTIAAKCPSLKEVRDQAACGSCWAFGAVTAMTDRICILSKGAQTPHLSAADMLSCCDSCGMGCEGGYPSAAWDYWTQTGVVTGGNYGGAPCYPYEIPQCDHHVHGRFQPCGPIVDTPDCRGKCIDSSVNWDSDKRMGKSAYGVPSDQNSIMAEIMNNGPVEVAFSVYEDFLTYRSGVYSHRTGQMLGGHAVKMLGWGVDGSTPYWIVANSWNEDWGNNGFFNILRGRDECGIESEVVAGMPNL